MEKKEMEVFSQAINLGIVRMPGRKFPGSVIQGDSLRYLLALAEEIEKRTKDSTDEELIDTLGELKELLSERLVHYEEILKEHSIELPYDGVVSEAGSENRAEASRV